MTITHTRNVDDRLAPLRAKAAVTRREFNRGRRDQAELDAVTAELRAAVAEVTIERAVTDLSAEIEAGNLNTTTYRIISELHAKATQVAMAGGLAE
jgi:hypothetical protein